MCIHGTLTDGGHCWRAKCLPAPLSCVECQRGHKQKGRVSFADQFGFALATVKILPEQLDDWSDFKLFDGAALAKSLVSEVPTLTVNFNQPSENYVEFWMRLERYNLCLENVRVENNSLVGTVKVKNIAFEKTVFVRCTFDDWKTRCDIAARYVNAMTSLEYDTFSFELHVPPFLRIGDKVRFAICYRVNSETFWDNNYGHNYEVPIVGRMKSALKGLAGGGTSQSIDEYSSKAEVEVVTNGYCADYVSSSTGSRKLDLYEDPHNSEQH